VADMVRLTRTSTRDRAASASDGGLDLLDHQASAGVECSGPLRPVPDYMIDLPRVEEETLPPRPGRRALGWSQGAAQNFIPWARDETTPPGDRGAER